ncbi:phosphoribosylformylglycinamidine synthase [Thermonema lapsum]|jgi:phosphoribosylformylglycinamidine synthase|uniref:Phosphoribosylformylglycinamidine synthase subunit PurS n=1 Tax=Thermonema lapsum TaxID=28195 RepID=A0A846MR32_9BACT|nr:phosphoribosylformylglycinamidine synthase subunit PurS [Thermonema lapsum]NIK74118.1 phosphoribosylformylglycinamidine synthase [Thermonema lapsum]
MKFVAEINVMPKKELLDPQGKAVKMGLKHLHIDNVKDVRIGKHIVLTLEAASSQEAREIVDNACQKLLANVIMEDYSFEIRELQESLKQ